MALTATIQHQYTALVLTNFLFFVIGACAGSFLNVISLRYQPEESLLGRGVISGRSRCPHCRRILRAVELIPLVSFIAQKGRCRSCGVRLSLQYPVVEAIAGLIFVLTPIRLSYLYVFAPERYLFILSFLWIAAFLILLLISLIDFHYYIIPDQLNIILGVLGIALIGANIFLNYSDIFYGSFIGNYSLLFYTTSSIAFNHIIGSLAAALFFAALIYGTKGAGMGWGDFKLAAAIGALVGWPDVALSVVFAFLAGGLAGVFLLILGRKNMRGVLPFGPFLALGVAALFFGGREIIEYYFIVMGLYPVI
jgi:leader peptidase (prepilin peptidase)/N-methyltransferase